MKQFIVIISILICTVWVNANVGIDYLNSLRNQAGLPAFTENVNLSAAAQNHSAYMQTESVLSHYETNSSNKAYTSVLPRGRVVYAGYDAAKVSENISYGTLTVKESIDDLMSSIYHRFGFLNLDWNEIGIGISNNHKFYTYDAGNSFLNVLCQSDTYNGGDYYANMCADDSIKINASDFIGAIDKIRNEAQNLILWPASNSSNIPPVFYEETPDPLPNYSVSGYPVSVEFNSKNEFNASLLSVESFTLSDAKGSQLNIITSMNNQNDPNSRFTDLQFALFPEKRLAWGSRYEAEIIYDYNGTQTTKNWCFTTASLSGEVDRFYNVDNNANITYKVVSGKTYAIYVTPNNGNDKLKSYTYRGVAISVEDAFIDSNTISIKIVGNTGDYVNITFANGQKIKLVVDSSDTATKPLNQSCIGVTDRDGDGVADVDDAFPYDHSESVDTDNDGIGNNADTDDDNDGILDVVETANGLNPLNASDAQEDLDNDGFSNSSEISAGTDIRDANSYPTWTPIMMDNIIIFIPAVK